MGELCDKRLIATEAAISITQFSQVICLLTLPKRKISWLSADYIANHIHISNQKKHTFQNWIESGDNSQLTTFLQPLSGTISIIIIIMFAYILLLSLPIIELHLVSGGLAQQTEIRQIGNAPNMIKNINYKHVDSTLRGCSIIYIGIVLSPDKRPQIWLKRKMHTYVADGWQKGICCDEIYLCILLWDSSGWHSHSHTENYVYLSARLSMGLSSFHCGQYNLWLLAPC